MQAHNRSAYTAGDGPHSSKLSEAKQLLSLSCSKRIGKHKSDEWLRFFDVVIVGSGKPGFFSERRPLFAVNTKDGSLQNTDNGAPIIPIGEEDFPEDMQVGMLHVVLHLWVILYAVSCSWSPGSLAAAQPSPGLVPLAYTNTRRCLGQCCASFTRIACRLHAWMLVGKQRSSLA